MSHEAIELLVAALFGSGGIVASVQWWIERRRKTSEATLKRIDENVSANTLRLDKIEEGLAKHQADSLNHQQVVRRHFLFTEPRSRGEHEDLLDIGRHYLDDHGNGAGHARYDVLEADYKRRMKDNDWEYSDKPKKEES